MQCDFVYSKSKRICSLPGTADCGDRVRCKLHRVAKIRNAHPKRLNKMILRLLRHLKTSESLPQFDWKCKLLFLSKALEFVLMN